MTTESLQTLSSDIHQELHQALQLLTQNLSRVESELDLECANLRDLVSERNPEVQRQIDSLSSSISELHGSLADVKQKIQVAYKESGELEEFTKDRPEQSVIFGNVDAGGEAAPAPEEILSPQEASKIRHDEKITLSGIFRALFMAEEPGQRFINQPKDTKKDAS